MRRRLCCCWRRRGTASRSGARHWARIGTCDLAYACSIVLEPPRVIRQGLPTRTGVLGIEIVVWHGPSFERASITTMPSMVPAASPLHRNPISSSQCAHGCRDGRDRTPTTHTPAKVIRLTPWCAKIGLLTRQYALHTKPGRHYLGFSVFGTDRIFPRKSGTKETPDNLRSAKRFLRTPQRRKWPRAHAREFVCKINGYSWKYMQCGAVT